MRDSPPTSPPLFDDLQARLVSSLGRRGVSDLSVGTIVVLPSITFPPEELRKIIGIEHYEERMLCMLLLLRRPRLEVVYLTSVPIEPEVIAYYLSFLPDPDDARRRLHLFSIDDPSPRALSEKLLDRHDVIESTAASIPDAGSAYLFPFNVTSAERTLSERLGVALYGPHPRHVALGSKSGSRHVARSARVPVLDGSEDLHSAAEIEAAIDGIRTAAPNARQVVLKLNNGFSGQGNAIIQLGSKTSPLEDSEVTFCASEESWASFLPKVEKEGAIVEELVDEEGVVSPSVQMRILGNGEYEVVSTHDQLLGGPSDQVYLGCRFPARPEYRLEIQAFGLALADELSKRGVIGTFGADFVVVPGRGTFLTEINLRLGGTTHPFLMARFVTGGIYEMSSGDLLVGGKTKSYVATDNWKSPGYVGLAPVQVIEALATAGLAYDPDTQTGVTLHLLGALPHYGKLGATCIGDSIDHAQELHDRALDLLASMHASPG